MILAPLSDPFLRAVVRRAALPEEDVFCCPSGVGKALFLGYPRLLVYELGSLSWSIEGGLSKVPELPTLVLNEPVLRHVRANVKGSSRTEDPIDDSARRLRGLIKEAAAASRWVEGLFSDLGGISGQGPPPEFRGFARRILEYPVRYPSPKEMAEVVELSSGALKERFRRRGLPSPALYIRWFRVMAAARVLSDPKITTLAASFRLGFSSDGNFCRWVQATSGLSTTVLRSTEGRVALLARFARRCLMDQALEKWRSLEGLFLREVA
ncbi:helix-turn-helix domain-containing protein [Gemmatimonadota bacterium]